MWLNYLGILATICHMDYLQRHIHTSQHRNAMDMEAIIGWANVCWISKGGLRGEPWIVLDPTRVTKTRLGLFDWLSAGFYCPGNPDHRTPQNFGYSVWCAYCVHHEINCYIMTSSSWLTHYRGTPSQDKGIHSSNQDQCIAHNATIVPPHLHHNCHMNKILLRPQEFAGYKTTISKSSWKHWFSIQTLSLISSKL